ncbi:hypothetical protein MLC52_05360 [Sulfurimonas sp. NW15]|uniref:hypothetical protein n=1 Tax=Sulfurimonas sp. NW15 TaxID=2922729 RepID=UPI003DA868A2
MSKQNKAISDIIEFIENLTFSKQTKKKITANIGLFIKSKEDSIDFDLADIKTILSDKDKFYFGQGKGKPKEALYLAITDAKLSLCDLEQCTGFLVKFILHPDANLSKVSEAIEIIDENAHEDADIIFGTTSNESMGIDDVEVVLLVSKDIFER